MSEHYLGVNNFINLFQLSIEKIILALIMAFIIINAEIDLSVASLMGLSACLFAWLYAKDVPPEVAILAALVMGAICGAFNGFWIAYAGLPSLVVTLASLVMFRGGARILLEDRSIGLFPQWFNNLGQPNFVGPFSFGIIVFAVLFVISLIVLHFTAFGRYVYIIGNNRHAARYAGIKVRQTKMILFTVSGLVASLGGLLLAARLGTVRANLAEEFELDVITMVLLGGVSIFGGTGTLIGVGLSILVVLNLRNGMSLANYSGNIQTAVVGVLLIASVLLPNLLRDARRWQRLGFRSREVLSAEEEAQETQPTDTVGTPANS
ncbi:MAG: ABC transporter permease [Chloroflexi bacterium]|nr:ABC transporter permease [Chloroflexota bacterium]